MFPDLSKMAEVGAFVERLDQTLAELLVIAKEGQARSRRIEAHLAAEKKAKQESEACV